MSYQSSKNPEISFVFKDTFFKLMRQPAEKNFPGCKCVACRSSLYSFKFISTLPEPFKRRVQCSQYSAFAQIYIHYILHTFKHSEYLFSIFRHFPPKDRNVSSWLLMKKLSHPDTLRHLLVTVSLPFTCSASGQTL